MKILLFFILSLAHAAPPPAGDHVAPEREKVAPVESLSPECDAVRPALKDICNRPRGEVNTKSLQEVYGFLKSSCSHAGKDHPWIDNLNHALEYELNLNETAEARADRKEREVISAWLQALRFQLQNESELKAQTLANVLLLDQIKHPVRRQLMQEMIQAVETRNYNLDKTSVLDLLMDERSQFLFSDGLANGPFENICTQVPDRKVWSSYTRDPRLILGQTLLALSLRNQRPKVVGGWTSQEEKLFRQFSIWDPGHFYAGEFQSLLDRHVFREVARIVGHTHVAEADAHSLVSALSRRTKTYYVNDAPYAPPVRVWVNPIPDPKSHERTLVINCPQAALIGDGENLEIPKLDYVTGMTIVRQKFAEGKKGPWTEHSLSIVCPPKQATVSIVVSDRAKERFEPFQKISPIDYSRTNKDTPRTGVAVISLREREMVYQQLQVAGYQCRALSLGAASSIAKADYLVTSLTDWSMENFDTPVLHCLHPNQRADHDVFYLVQGDAAGPRKFSVPSPADGRTLPLFYIGPAMKELDLQTHYLENYVPGLVPAAISLEWQIRFDQAEVSRRVADTLLAFDRKTKWEDFRAGENAELQTLNGAAPMTSWLDGLQLARELRLQNAKVKRQKNAAAEEVHYLTGLFQQPENFRNNNSLRINLEVPPEWAQQNPLLNARTAFQAPLLNPLQPRQRTLGDFKRAIFDTTSVGDNSRALAFLRFPVETTYSSDYEYLLPLSLLAQGDEDARHLLVESGLSDSRLAALVVQNMPDYFESHPPMAERYLSIHPRSSSDRITIRSGLPVATREKLLKLGFAAARLSDLPHDRRLELALETYSPTPPVFNPEMLAELETNSRAEMWQAAKLYPSLGKRMVNRIDRAKLDPNMASVLAQHDSGNEKIIQEIINGRNSGYESALKEFADRGNAEAKKAYLTQGSEHDYAPFPQFTVEDRPALLSGISDGLKIPDLRNARLNGNGVEVLKLFTNHFKALVTLGEKAAPAVPLAQAVLERLNSVPDANGWPLAERARYAAAKALLVSGDQSPETEKLFHTEDGSHAMLFLRALYDLKYGRPGAKESVAKIWIASSLHFKDPQLPQLIRSVGPNAAPILGRMIQEKQNDLMVSEVAKALGPGAFAPIYGALTENYELAQFGSVLKAIEGNPEISGPLLPLLYQRMQKVSGIDLEKFLRAINIARQQEAKE